MDDPPVPDDELQCLWCDSPFEPGTGDGPYCSWRCASDHTAHLPPDAAPGGW